MAISKLSYHINHVGGPCSPLILFIGDLFINTDIARSTGERSLIEWLESITAFIEQYIFIHYTRCKMNGLFVTNSSTRVTTFSNFNGFYSICKYTVASP